LKKKLSNRNVQKNELNEDFNINKSPILLEPSKGKIIVNKEICIGCRKCEIICSLENEEVINPELSRIKVIRNPLNGSDFTPLTCHQCINPSCLFSCPVDDIQLDTKTRTLARIIDESLCTGCKNCIEACPFDPSRITFNEIKNIAIKCDLCGGNPKCVQYCPVGALTYDTDLQILKRISNVLDEGL
jgi:Fe-S-cluster-containing hydrogenase component 2